MADAEDAGEEEITRIARERPADSGDIPLADLGVDLDELERQLP